MEIVRTLPVGPTAPSEARHSLLALEGAVASDRLDDLVLVVSELVTNAVTHSGLRGAESVILKVRMLSGSRIRVEVEDAGGGFPDVTTPPTDQHGRGLAIVARLADRWGTERNGQTRVWAEMTLR
jgi:anti-sigma regulatory factor (Ser/Thr protein kinase)